MTNNSDAGGSPEPTRWFGVVVRTGDEPKQDPPPAREPREKESRDFNRKQQAAFEAAMVGLVTGSVDRAKNSVTVVQAASSALLAIYTGMLGFVYSTTGQALPFVAVVTPLFLGLAVLLSTYYTSFLSPTIDRKGDPDSRPPFIDEGSPDRQMIGRINALVVYVARIVKRRAWALRASVAALAVGLVCLPLPFIQAPGDASADSATWIGVTLPSAPPDEVPADLREAYFTAQIADATAEAEAQRAAAGEVVANPLDPHAVWIVLGGAVIVLLAALPGFIEWLRQRRSSPTSVGATEPDGRQGGDPGR